MAWEDNDAHAISYFKRQRMLRLEAAPKLGEEMLDEKDTKEEGVGN